MLPADFGFSVFPIALAIKGNHKPILSICQGLLFTVGVVSFIFMIIFKNLRVNLWDWA